MKSLGWPRLIGLLLAAALSISFAASPAQATEAMRGELARLAEGVSKMLLARNATAISIGQFTGPPTFPSNAGPGIVKILSEEFEKCGINCTKRAEIGIQGNYIITEIQTPDPNNSLRTQNTLAVQIRGSLVSSLGQVLTDFSSGQIQGVELKDGEFKTIVVDEETIVQTTGVPVSLPADEPAHDRQERIKEKLTSLDDNGHIAGSIVSANRSSPYAVEVLVAGAPCPASFVDGLPFVKIDKGQLYMVRLINNSDKDAAVKLSIDGLSCFAFSDVRHVDGPKQGQPKYSVWIVPAKGDLVVRGWHKDNGLVRTFKVGSYEESAAATLNHTSDIGCITATFAAAWDASKPPPPDEPPAKKGLPNATGFGPPSQMQVVEIARRIGVIRASVSVRYSLPQ